MTPLVWLAYTRGRIRGGLIRTLVSLFLEPREWRDAEAKRFAAEASLLVAGAQRTLADAVSVAFTEHLTRATGERWHPPSLRDASVTHLRGVEPRQVYRRPFHEVYRELSKGENLDTAVDRGVARLEAIGDLDLQQTYRDAADQVLRRLPDRATKPKYWVRVPQGTFTCALCILASTQRYRTGDLNPIHPACDCTVEPIPGNVDPGSVADRVSVESLHRAVEELFGFSERTGRGQIDYRKLFVQTLAEHGEVGQVFVRPGQRFTGRDQLRPAMPAATPAARGGRLRPRPLVGAAGEAAGSASDTQAATLAA